MKPVCFRLCAAGVAALSIPLLACGRNPTNRERSATNPCDADAAHGAVNICLVPETDQDRKGQPVTDTCFWMNKAIGNKDLDAINSPGGPANYDVYVYNYCREEATVDLKFIGNDIRCIEADVAGVIALGAVPPTTAGSDTPVRATCTTVPYEYDTSAPTRRAQYSLTATIGSSRGTYDPQVALERAGDPTSGPPPRSPVSAPPPPVPRP